MIRPIIYQFRSDSIVFTSITPGKNYAIIGGFAIKIIPVIHAISDIIREQFNFVSFRIKIE